MWRHVTQAGTGSSEHAKVESVFHSNAVQRRNEDARERRVMGDDENDDRWDLARRRGREHWCAFPFYSLS